MGIQMENLLLTRCELKFSAESFCIHAPDEAIARQLKTSFRWLAVQAQRLGKNETRVYFPGCRKPYQIPVSMATPDDGEVEQVGESLPPASPSPDLLGADYMRILEFLMECRQDGNIVAIVSNTTDICYHTNDLLRPSRAYWNAHQFTGYQYLNSWRRDRSILPGSPGFQTNTQYDRLKELLARDGSAPNYEYQLYRPDGALCSYSTTYLLCRDYCGDEVRVGVSRPPDWALLEPAAV